MKNPDGQVFLFILFSFFFLHSVTFSSKLELFDFQFVLFLAFSVFGLIHFISLLFYSPKDRIQFFRSSIEWVLQEFISNSFFRYIDYLLPSAYGPGILAICYKYGRKLRQSFRSSISWSRINGMIVVVFCHIVAYGEDSGIVC
jgi:hypothetical protein